MQSCFGADSVGDVFLSRSEVEGRGRSHNPPLRMLPALYGQCEENGSRFRFALPCTWAAVAEYMRRFGFLCAFHSVRRACSLAAASGPVLLIAHTNSGDWLCVKPGEATHRLLSQLKGGYPAWSGVSHRWCSFGTQQAALTLMMLHQRRPTGLFRRVASFLHDEWWPPGAAVAVAEPPVLP